MSEGLGSSRLKKLFRASKTPGAMVEPLPLPDHIPNNAQPPPPQPPQSSRHHHHHDQGPTKRRHHHPNNVTPFPVDVGRHQQPPPPPPPQPLPPHDNNNPNLTPISTTPTHHAPPVPPPPRPSRDHRSPPQPGHHHTPTLAEIHALEQAGAYGREGSDHHAPIYAARSRRGTDSSSIDGWLAGTQPQRVQLGNGPEPPYATTPYGSQLPSPSAQPNYFLPPGAGPPLAEGYGAPTPSQPTRMGHMSQSSIPNLSALPPTANAGYPGDMDAYATGRNRGYSSASQSGRGSDHESGGGGGSVGGAGGAGPGSVHHGGMLNKPSQPAQTGRSPLAQSYSSDMSKPQPPIPEPPTAKEKEKEKEKKSFWKRVGGGDRKSKDQRENKSKENLALDRVPSAFSNQPPHSSMDDITRPSADDYREGSFHGDQPSVHGHAPMAPSAHGHASAHGHSSSVGHGFEESRLRARGLDLNIMRRDDDHQTENDVSAAVRQLCSSRATRFPDVLELCEKINDSENQEIVGREAARSIRKVFKNGTDPERRMAARVWLITMLNVSAKDYHRFATSRKMMATIEPILKQEAKPPVSQATYKTTFEILSFVTFDFHANRGCEGLLDLWNKVKRPGDPEFGTKLPNEYLPISPEPRRSERKEERRDEFPRPVMAGARSPLPSPAPSVLSRPPSEPLSRGMHSSLRGPGGSPPHVGVPYTALPDHDGDVRRLFDECNRAITTAGQLHQACVFANLDTFEADQNLHDLWRESLQKQEQLTSQMAWAQAEAERSRRIADSIPRAEKGTLATQEESAVQLLCNALDQLAKAVKEYEDISDRCMEERQMREVQERSKTDTRMDRRQQMDMLAAPGEAVATTSRSPSPSYNNMPLPPESGRSPRTTTTDSSHGHSSQGGHVDSLSAPMGSLNLETKRSRSPSPNRLPAVPKIHGQSPPRSGSPLGRSRVPGPRPLPHPGAQFKSINSNPNLVASAYDHGQRGTPARGGSGSSAEGAPTSNGSAIPDGDDGDDAPVRPSRKALGKRRAVPDEDNDFDPNDMFTGGAPKKTDADSDSNSITADEVYLSKPVKYAYDAWAEAMQREKEEAASRNASAPGLRSPAAVTAPAVSAR